MAASAKVIGPGVKYAGAPDNAERPRQTDLLVKTLVSSIALCVGLHVAQVAHVSHLVVGAGMHVAMRVKVRPGSRATVGQIAEHVHVEAVELARVQPCESAVDLGAGEDTLLFEEHDAPTRLIRLRVEDADGPARLTRQLRHL